MHSLLPLSVVTLSLLCACTEAQPPAEEPLQQAPDSANEREPLIHLHVPSKSVAGAAQFKADWSYDLVVAPGWSAHVHVIPPGQLVPPHRHPNNDEFSWVASGQAEWTSWTAGAEPITTQVEPGTALVAPKGAVHGIRNTGVEDLSVVVIHQPSFGQNWYVLPDEVTSDAPSPALGIGHALPDGLFASWTLKQINRQDSLSLPADSLYLVSGGRGTLAFEETKLPLTAGHFVKVPPGLEHSLLPDPGEEPSLSFWVVRVPR